MSASRLAAHLPVADLPPAVQRLRAVAQALGDLAERVVFIGGSVAPLLQEAPPFAPRATQDVDGVVMTASGTEFAALQAALRARGFREAVHHGSHAHRWIAPTPEQDAFDLVSAGTHHGAMGNPIDAAAIADAWTTTFADGLVVRHASVAGFLAMKWTAHEERFGDDPAASRDLEDILGLLASRNAIAAEVAAAPDALRQRIQAAAARLLTDPYAEDYVAGHLNHARDARQVRRLVMDRLRLIEAGAVKGQ